MPTHARHCPETRTSPSRRRPSKLTRLTHRHRTAFRLKTWSLADPIRAKSIEINADLTDSQYIELASGRTTAVALQRGFASVLARIPVAELGPDARLRGRPVGPGLDAIASGGGAGSPRN